jgi:hypothetical protein
MTILEALAILEAATMECKQIPIALAAKKSSPHRVSQQWFMRVHMEDAL